MKVEEDWGMYALGDEEGSDWLSVRRWEEGRK